MAHAVRLTFLHVRLKYDKYSVWMMALSVTLSVTPPLFHHNRTVRYCTLSAASIAV